MGGTVANNAVAGVFSRRIAVNCSRTSTAQSGSNPRWLPSPKIMDKKNNSLSPDRLSRRLALGWRLVLLVLGQIVMGGLVFGQSLTHGPVVGGVTASSANVFLRTSMQTTVSLRYGTDPNLTGFEESSTFETSSDSDFTKIVPLAGLAAEQTYYLNPVVNGVPQLSAPYPSFTTFPADGSSRTFKFIVLTDFETVTNLTKTTSTFASAAAESPAFAFIGGDFDHRNPTTLDQKREMFKDSTTHLRLYEWLCALDPAENADHSSMG